MNSSALTEIKKERFSSLILKLNSYFFLSEKSVNETYGSLDFGIKVPNSLIRSLMLNRLRLSTTKQKQQSPRLGTIWKHSNLQNKLWNQEQLKPS